MAIEDRSWQVIKETSSGLRVDARPNLLVGHFPHAPRSARVFANTDPMLGAIDLYPTSDALRGPPLDLNGWAHHFDHTRDFNSDPHDGTWRGAYAGFGTNPVGGSIAASSRSGWTRARRCELARCNDN